MAVAYKEVAPHQLNLYLKDNRQLFEEGISLIGLLVFDNKVKAEAPELIAKLKVANIESKIITGDNVFVAMETAMRCDILKDEKVIVFEGRNQPKYQIDKTFKGKMLEKVEGFVKQSEVYFSEDEFKTQSHSLVIDHEFLEMNPPSLEKVSVFARIPPESKARIIT